ncbi:MAG: hypothetical protein GFH27_549397n36 [Chloroflexi bacterium AL-W]|nr:hypothetical protein [Chloroflexi bacterium AL-W]
MLQKGCLRQKIFLGKRLPLEILDNHQVEVTDNRAAISFITTVA